MLQHLQTFRRRLREKRAFATGCAGFEEHAMLRVKLAAKRPGFRVIVVNLLALRETALKQPENFDHRIGGRLRLPQLRDVVQFLVQIASLTDLTAPFPKTSIESSPLTGRHHGESLKRTEARTRLSGPSALPK